MSSVRFTIISVRIRLWRWRCRLRVIDREPVCIPGSCPAVEYGAGDMVRKVDDQGKFSLRGKRHRVGRAFAGQAIAVRCTPIDGVMDVFTVIRRLPISICVTKVNKGDVSPMSPNACYPCPRSIQYAGRGLG